MSELPQGWDATELGNIGRWCSGGTPSRSHSEYFGDGVHWVKSGDLPDGEILTTSESITEVGLSNSSAKLMPEGTICLALYGATIGKLGIMTFPAATNQACANLIPDDRVVNKKYAFYYLFSERQTFIDLGQGGAQPNISQEIVRKHAVPLPPLNEQRRIVAKLEEVLTKVDASQKRLARIPVILKRFRQAVLAAACSGRLTADWREEKGIGEGEDLPEGWQRLSLRGLCDGFQYGTSTKSEPSGKVPVIRMGNIQNGKIDWTNLAYTSDAVEIRKYKLNPGDVLFNRTNSPELVGKTAIYRGEHPAIFAGYLIKIKNRSGLDSEYLNYCLNSFQAKEWCQQVKTDGVSQSNINAQKLADYEINFPPLPEQQEIVRRVDSYFSLADQLEARYHNAKTHIDRLTQSILAKAFRGELVPQDPNDEPASVFLERICSQREATPKTSRKKNFPEISVTREPEKLPKETPPPAIKRLHLSGVARKILRFMKRNMEYSKDDIAVPLILSTSEWNCAIRELKEVGAVVQTGDKRGARYIKK